LLAVASCHSNNAALASAAAAAAAAARISRHWRHHSLQSISSANDVDAQPAFIAAPPRTIACLPRGG